MANLKISELTEFTGNPIGTYLVIDNSSQDTTYKVKRENFILPNPILTSTYGLFSQTGNSDVISATTVESSIINGGVGTLSVGANQFTIGDSFRAVAGGVLSAGNNQQIQLKVKSGPVILADSGLQPITNITDDIFHLVLDFTIRNIGTTGVADIAVLGSFKYSKTVNGAVEGFAFNTINNTTFDTTIQNTLDVTVQWGSTNADNKINTDIFILNKTH